MSSVGQAIGGIVGGVIGFFVGGPSGALYGAQIGLAVGGVIDPPDGPVINGPRLDDLSVQTSTYGAFIPRNYGTVAQNGNIFWLKGDKLTETPRAEESGGKGGSTTTTNLWDYSATFALGLCEGPIAGIRRIWINGQLWYDGGSNDIESIIYSNETSNQFTLYTGTDTQLADPLIQADKGAANVPAYRGLAYIVFDNLSLAKYNNSLAGAQIKVEIVKSLSALSPRLIDSIDIPGYPVKYYPHPALVTGEGLFSVFVYDPFNPSDKAALDITYTGALVGINADFPPRLLEPQTTSSGTITTAIGYFDGEKVWWPEYSASYAIQNGTRKILPWGDVVNKDTTAVYASRGDIADALTGESGRFIIGIAFCNSEEKILIVTGASARSVNALADRYFILDKYLSILSSGTIANTTLSIWNVGNATSASPDGGSVFDEVNSVGWTTYVPTAGFIGTRYFYLDSAGTMQISAEIVSEMAGAGYLAAVYSSGIFYVVSRNSTVGRLYRYTAFPTITDATAVLGDIVSAECLKSNLLTAADIDVTELTDAVRGYRISSLGALRGGIDPVRAVWPFDVVQNGYKIKFKRRGSASVVTINADELDARAAGENPGVQITNSREMDTLLPSKLLLKYIDASREYDNNEQPSDRNL